MPESRELVLIGKITATHGVRGQLRVVPFSGDSGTILSLGSLLLRGPKGELESFALDQSIVHGKKILVRFKEFPDINQVQHLVGREIYVQRDQLPELPDDEYYWCDLLGIDVVTTAGEMLGKVADLIATGSNDVYVIRGGDKEYLIPALDDVVISIDLDARVMTVSPLEGLLDL